MPVVPTSAIDGRAASIARRRALSAGKAALSAAPQTVVSEALPAFDEVAASGASETATAPIPHVTGDSPVRDGVVTGTSRGSAREITGTPYQRQPGGESGRARVSGTTITGDAPVNANAVTGTARGAEREVTGTPYYREAAAVAETIADPVAAVAARFSVGSPQRSAQISARSRDAENAGPRVTGSFAIAHEKVTGNLEFAYAPRKNRSDEAPARTAVTGEGSTAGSRVTGIAWSEHPNVTGTEGATASGRNPSERGGRQQAFAGARTFKPLASHEEPKHLVTGTFGYSSDSAAKVTLSGGAQG